MRLLIVSDIHGSFLDMKQVIMNESKFDKLVILGDILSGYGVDDYDPEQLALLLNLFKDKIICVKGNCDNSYLYMLEFDVQKSFETLEVDGMTFFFTHGHLFNMSNMPSFKIDVLLQGHTHVYKFEKKDDVIYVNPGSVSMPRGGHEKTYMIYDNGEFILKNLDGQIVNRFNI